VRDNHPVMNSIPPGLVVLLGASPEEAEQWARSTGRDPRNVMTMETIPIGVAIESKNMIPMPGWQPHPTDLHWWRAQILTRLIAGVEDEDFVERLNDVVPGFVPENWIRWAT
jgi:hypothetical protein